MLPLSLLKTAQGHPMVRTFTFPRMPLHMVQKLVELKNGETYNGHLVNCDTWMNIHLREVICTSKDGDRFWRMPECYIRGNTIKYLRVPDEVSFTPSISLLNKLSLSSVVLKSSIHLSEAKLVIDKVQEETKSRADRKPPGVGRGRGRGREDGPGGRQPKGAGRGLDDSARTTSGGRGRGGSGGKNTGGRGKLAESPESWFCCSADD
ncbi:sm-like protein LSM4 [Gossypium australe]|uniref:U6 snRNA-associated Sm-like protein LSm4 n=1 Tax=Gossypium australe TaxID=47621 RepID=A0A5B6VQB6_9ROSI|nr:sm-like protein LSM4 [Gossypium australe]